MKYEKPKMEMIFLAGDEDVVTNSLINGGDGDGGEIDWMENNL